MRPFEYAVLRIVPRIDRGEFVNGAVLVYSQTEEYLDIRVRRDLACVLAICPGADLGAITTALDDAAAAARGEVVAMAGLSPGVRFRWLTAPRSVVVQPGPIHTGMTADCARELDRLASVLLD